jgi:hypothetical protein
LAAAPQASPYAQEELSRQGAVDNSVVNRPPLSEDLREEDEI